MTEEQSLKFFLGPGVNTTAGVHVDHETAMRHSTVYQCVRIISEDLASLPAHTYRRIDEDSSEKARDHWLYPLFYSQPNPYQTNMEFIELMTGDAMLRGAGLARMVTDGSGRVVELRRMHPDRVRPVPLANGEMAFDFRQDDGKTVRLGWEQVFKVFGPFGMSVLEYARSSIGLGMVQHKYASKYFSSFGKPGGVIQMKTSFENDEAIKRFKQRWHDTYSGIDNAYNLAVLEEGSEWKPVELNNHDAQMLESQKDSRADIAACFRVPLHMLNESGHVTYNSVEQRQLAYYMQTVRSWSVRWEKSVERDLLLPAEQGKIYLRFNIAAMLRGDMQTRNAAYAMGRQNGWLSVNDVRRMEDMNPIGPDGDKYLVQAGYVPVDMLEEYLKQKKESGASSGREQDLTSIEIHNHPAAEAKAIAKVIRTWRDENGHLQAEVKEQEVGDANV